MIIYDNINIISHFSGQDPDQPTRKKERYLLQYIGSVETNKYKGTKVLCQAVKKILGAKSVFFDILIFKNKV